VFEATVAAARPRRLVYTSSAAAYGYHPDNPVPLTEDVPPRGSPEHYYSQQKAACEAALAEITAGSALEVFIPRPCIVAGWLSALMWRPKDPHPDPPSAAEQRPHRPRPAGYQNRSRPPTVAMCRPTKVLNQARASGCGSARHWG